MGVGVGVGVGGWGVCVCVGVGVGVRCTCVRVCIHMCDHMHAHSPYLPTHAVAGTQHVGPLSPPPSSPPQTQMLAYSMLSYFSGVSYKKAEVMDPRIPLSFPYANNQLNVSEWVEVGYNQTDAEIMVAVMGWVRAGGRGEAAGGSHEVGTGGRGGGGSWGIEPKQCPLLQMPACSSALRTSNPTSSCTATA